MVLHKLGKLDDYLTYIKGTPSELDELYKDILIHVTGFFRDAEAYGALREQVFPNLFRDRKPEDGPVRVRSEEHTSELQSQSNLVCRLLLEKKKTNSPKGDSLHIDAADTSVLIEIC